MKNQKINYDRVMRKMVSDWESREERPSILIHSCCAPCSTYTLELLTEYADVAIYFANPNIHPKAEYQRRAKVQEDFVLCGSYGASIYLTFVFMFSLKDLTRSS